MILISLYPERQIWTGLIDAYSIIYHTLLG
jgi:hypothetical protein